MAYIVNQVINHKSAYKLTKRHNNKVKNLPNMAHHVSAYGKSKMNHSSSHISCIYLKEFNLMEIGKYDKAYKHKHGGYHSTQ